MIRPLTVKELAERLQQMIAQNPGVADFEVDSEGCDCIEPAWDVYPRGGPYKNRILVSRSPQ